MKKVFVGITLLLLTAGLAARAENSGDDFTPCSDAPADSTLAGSLCAHFQAPRDHGVPNGGKITLFLRQFPAAAPSRGQVWLVAGESGAPLYPQIEVLRRAFPGYDLIIPDRRAAERAAAYDLQAEIDRYSKGGSTLLYGASHGGEVVLKALPLVRPRRVEAVILVNPVEASANEPSSPIPEAEVEVTAPRLLILQAQKEFTPPADLDRKSPLTVYRIDDAGVLSVTVPECAAPLVRDFIENQAEGGAPCAAKLSIRF